MSSFPDPAKAFAASFIDRNDRAFITLNDSIFYFGELGMQETRSAGLMTAILERHGFSVQRGISGFATSFVASYGHGAPVIAIHTEYDANPSNSQKPGIAERAEIVPGAPGHCEGHNTNAAVMVASALAIRHAMEKFALPGTLKIFGASAEEQLLSRPYFVRDGLFDDVDLAFHDHVLDRFGTDYGVIQSAAISAEFTFHGEAAHAAVSPWKGRDALDAVVLMDAGIAQYREHMKPTMTAHRVITNGGEQPNVIPSKAACWWYFRDPTAEGARVLFQRAQKIAQGAAMMANCELVVDVRAAVWPVRLNQTIAEVIQRNVELVGMPSWTEQENAFARSLQKQAGAAEIGLRSSADRLEGPAVQIAASNDCGDVSWKVPMGRIWFPSNVPHLPFHHWTAGAPLATSIAHKGGLAGAKALAASVIEFFQDRTLVVETKASFCRELAGTVYRPLLPEDQRAPAHLNLALMEKFRPQMEAYYLSDEPVFATP
jgi:aminobenzoyl-glutamate utilization protein B